MKKYLIGIVFLLGWNIASAQGTISPVNPIAAAGGGTVTFTCTANCGTGASWSCANASNGGTCIGSFNTGTHVYTPPATLAAKQSLGGYQLLPNDHIFNTRVDGLALRGDSSTLIAGAGTVPVNYLASFRNNYTNGSTPTDTLTFHYTPANNGTYQSPQWPSANIENGWFGAIANNSAVDHHLNTIDTTNGNIAERFQYYAQAPVTTCTVNGSNSATCTITPTNTSSGFTRSAAVGGNTVQIGSFTSGDTYLNGVFTLTGATLTSITFNITHAAASTSTTGQATSGVLTGSACDTAGTCNSQGGVKYTYADYALPAAATDAASMFLEPLTLHGQEVVQACANGTAINHALRMTLQNGFLHNAFLWPAQTSANAGAGANFYGERVRLKSAFAIGGFSACAQILLTQMKNYGLIIADGGFGWQIQTDFDDMPKAAIDAMQEINNASIATSNWEVVDESSLMESSGSGASSNGEIITYTSSTGTTTTHVNLQGNAVNVGSNQWYTIAATPQLQLPIYSNAAFTCAMSPSLGSLTSGGLYTAPASVTIGTKSQTTVTCTSSVTSSVKAQILVTVFPATNFNVIQSTTDFTDSHGVVWFSGSQYGFGMANVPQLQGCCQNDSSFTNITDKQLFWNRLYSSVTQGDYKVDVHVPNGVYLVTFNNGATLPIGADTRYFYSQGTLIATADSTVESGGLHLPYTLTTSAVVSNNVLSFYNAGIGFQSSDSGDISSISIMQSSGLAGSVVPSNVKIAPGVKIQ